mgnify:CR=1 FL=1
MSEEIDGYKLKVCKALIINQTIAGVDREAFILNATLGYLFIAQYRQFYMIPVILLIHNILYRICKKDPLVVKIFIYKYLHQRDYFYEG